MIKRVALSTLAGTVTSFLLGWVIMGVLFAGLMKEWTEAAGSCMVAEPGMVLIALANLILALLVSLLFVRMNVSTFVSGLLNGIWISFLLIVWYDVWMFATFDFMQMKFMVVDVVGNVVIGSITSGVIGWVLGKVN